jgi:hypothetical protein
MEKRIFPDITILKIDTAGNRIAFLDSKTPAKVVLQFRRFFELLYINTSRRRLRSYRILDPLVRHCVHQTGRGHADNGIGPIYSNLPIQLLHGIRSTLGGLWHSFMSPLLWHGAKTVGSEH